MAIPKILKTAALIFFSIISLLGIAACGDWHIGGSSGDPSAPAWINAAVISNSEIVVSWAPAAGQWSGYNLYRGIGTNAVTLYDSSLAVNAVSNTGLANNTQYCYSVSTLNDEHESAQTGPVCNTTSP